MGIRKVLNNFMLFILACSISEAASALPLIDVAVPSGTVKLQVFQDDKVEGLYWYVPTMVEPVIGVDGEPMSEIFRDINQLMFMYRGQASVDEQILLKLAKNLGVPRSNLKPIFYNSNSLNNAGCVNALFDPDEVKWLVPSQMGNFMEVLGMGLRTKNQDDMPMLRTLIEGKGLNCVYTYKFSSVSSAYRVHVSLNLNRIYERIQSEAHAEGFWWEADIKTFFEKLKTEGALVIKQYGDSGDLINPTETQMRAAFDDFLNKTIAMVFKPTLQIHDEKMVGRGRPWSLRTDYRRQEEYNHFEMDLDSQKVKESESTITVRMGIR